MIVIAGKLVDNKISWRGDSGLKDGSDEKLDLSKGMYDAGDHMKFGFPMAFTATVLSWSILEYGDQMDAVNQLQTAQGSLKWITDFLVNAHPKDNVLYIQVSSTTLQTPFQPFCPFPFLFLPYACPFPSYIQHCIVILNSRLTVGFLKGSFA